MANVVLVNQDSGEKTWLTPRWIVDALGAFDCDPCCPPQMPWKTATVMFTPIEDGLMQPWHGRVWLNPPYGKQALPFLSKMVEHVKHGGSGIALLFVRTDNKAWHELIAPYAKAVLFLRKRIKFCREDGSDLSSSPMPSALVAYSWADVDALVKANDKLQGFLMKGL